MTARFSPSRTGIEVRFGPEEIVLLRRLPTLLGAVGASPDDPALERLNPVAYRDDVEAEHEFARLVAPDLDSARGGDRSLFATTLDEVGSRGILTELQAESWVRVIGDARLALGARLGIEADDQLDLGAQPENPELLLLMYLGLLQEELVDVLLGRMGAGR